MQYCTSAFTPTFSFSQPELARGRYEEHGGIVPGQGESQFVVPVPVGSLDPSYELIGVAADVELIVRVTESGFPLVDVLH